MSDPAALVTPCPGSARSELCCVRLGVPFCILFLLLADGCASLGLPSPGRSPAAAWEAGADSASGSRQVTTYLADELSPRLTPRGDLVYVSNQGGNRDIWMRPAGGGLPRRLTNHSADDFDPAVSPDGKSIAFASRRLDAKGDIFIMRLDGSGARRLTGRNYAERQPVFLSAGRLAFTRMLKDGGEAIFALDLAGGDIVRLCKRPGFDPAPSADGRFLAFTSLNRSGPATRACIWVHRLLDGREESLTGCRRPEGFAAWATRQGHNWIVFSRFADDTNADGKIDVDDSPAIWKVRFNDFESSSPRVGEPQPLTPGTSADIMPAAYGDRIYYASRNDGDLDIWSVPLAGAARPSSCKAAIGIAGELDSELKRLFVLRRAAARNPETGDSRRCVLEEAATLLGWGRYAQAAEAYAGLAREARRDDIRGQALLGHIAASMEERLPLGMSPTRQEESRPLAANLIASLKKTGADPASIGLVRADILRRVGKFSEALDVLRVPLASSQQNLVARAHELRGEMLATLGAADDALRSFLQVLGMRAVSHGVQLNAAKRVIALVRKEHLAGLIADDPVESLERIVAAWPQLPVLPALARLEIADMHLDAKEMRLARNSFRLAVKLAGNVPQIATRALLSLSRMAESNGDLAEALDDANELFEAFPSLPRVRVMARRRIKSLAGRHALDLVQKGEIGMAIKVYRKLISQQQGDIVAHRRLMELMAGLGRAGEVAGNYQAMLDRRPNDALRLYLYGLALTYADPPRNFSRARDFIERSLAINSQAPFAHQTLGWLDEQLAGLEANEDWLHQAADEYQAALSLLDAKTDPRAEADLLLNLGNVHFALGNQRQAYTFYSLRVEKNISFINKERRLVFLEQYARSAWLSDHLDQAVGSFSQAAELAGSLGRKKRLPWLVAGKAAAYQLARKFDIAAETFRRACDLYAALKDNRRLASCRRNVAYNLYMGGKKKEAAREFVLAEKLLSEFASKDEQGGSSVSVSLAGRASRAAQGFDRAAELNFVHTFLGRIFHQSGDLSRAQAMLQKKATLLQERVAKKKDRDLLLDLSVATNQLGSLFADLGRPRRAAALFDKAARQAQGISNSRGQALNGINRLDLLLAGEISADPRGLVDELKEALLAAHTEESRASLKARLQNALGVAWAAVAERGAPAGKVQPVSFKERYQEALDGLSESVTALDRSAEAFGKSREEAALVPGRAGARLGAVAGWNLAQVLDRLGRADEAVKIKIAVGKQVADLALLGIDWRIEASSPDLGGRLKALLRLPPSIAGTDADIMAAKDRETLFGRLISQAADRGAAGDALVLVERVLARRRLAGVRASDLVPGEKEDHDFLAGLRKLTAALEKAMAELTPAGLRENGETKNREVLRALDSLVRFRDQGGKPSEALRALLSAKVATPDELSAILEPGEAIVEIFGLPERLLLFWIDGQGVTLKDVPVRRALLEREVEAVRGSDALRAAEARRRLSKWIMEPLAERLARIDCLVAVTDDLHLPFEWLIYAGKSLAGKLPVSHLYMASSLRLLRSRRNLNFGRAVWIGAKGLAGEAIGKGIEKIFGTLTFETRAGEAVRSAGDCGLVVWSVPATVDPRRPILSSLAPDAVIGSLGGVGFGWLASHQTRTGLWIMAGDGLDIGAGLVGAGLEQAMLGARVPAVLIDPGAAGGGLPAAVLTRMLNGLVEHGPARALARALEEIDERDSSWRDLIMLQLRGDPGLEAAGRRRYAESALAGAVQAAMGAYQRKEWARALSAFLEVRTLAGYLKRTDILPVVEKGIVTSAFNLSRYDLAIEHELGILAQARSSGNRLLAARAEQFMGVLESSAGRHEKAVGWLAKAVAGFDAAKSPADAARATATLALALDASAGYDKALAAARDALGRFEALRDESQVLRMTRFAGSIYLKRLNMAATAREWFERARGPAEKAGRKKLQAAVLLDLARTELAAGAYEEALELARSAEGAYRKLSDEHGQAEALLEQAKGLWYLAEYSRATGARRRALRLSESGSDVRLGIMARSLGGLIAMSMGDLDTAAKALTEALAKARQAELRDEEAVQLNNLGIVFREKGRLNKALLLFREAMEIDTRLKNSLGLAYDFRNIGIVEQMIGRLSQAGTHLARALDLTRAIGDRFNEVKILFGLARLDILTDNLPAALAQARAAHDLADELGLKEIVWRALRTIGEIARRRGDLDQARLNFAKSIELVEKMRAGLKIERIRSGFLDDKYALYGDMIHLLLARGEVGEAFAYAERSRSRGFLDLLSNRRIDIGGPLARELLDEVRRCKDRFARLEEDLRRIEGDGKAGALDDLAKARRAYEEALSRMRSHDPGLVDFVRVEPARPDELRAMLPAGVALLSYYVTEKDTLVWLLRADRLVAKRIDVGKARLAGMVAGLRRLMEGFSPVDEELAELYDLLVRPLEGELKGVNVVGVLPHDSLHYLPFAALKTDGKSYWADRVRIFESPSASVLKLVLRREQNRMGPAGSLVAFGDPALQDRAADLPFAAKEARAVAIEQPGGRAYVGPAATEAEVRSTAPASEIVHLACHASYDPANPLASALLLAPGQGLDGRLTAREVLSMTLSARLVTLSACRTALGKISGGDEIVGLARAFLAAGADGVLASLWRVSDVASAVLMKRFYRNLRTQPMLDALYHAQQVVRRYFPHPAYWAGFVLTGTW